MKLNIEDIFQRLNYLGYNPTIHSRGNNDIIEFYRTNYKFTINCRKYLVRIMTSVSEFELLAKHGPSVHKYIRNYRVTIASQRNLRGCFVIRSSVRRGIGNDTRRCVVMG